MKPKSVEQKANGDRMADMSGTTYENTISVARAAELLGLSHSIVARYVKRGRLKGAKIPGGRSYVVDVESVRAFGEEDRRPGNPNFSRKPS
jgi:excisionase family DNA binding protein